MHLFFLVTAAKSLAEGGGLIVGWAVECIHVLEQKLVLQTHGCGSDSTGVPHLGSTCEEFVFGADSTATGCRGQFS